MEARVTPWLIHVNLWQNPLQCCEVISLQLIKINEKKRGMEADGRNPLWGKILLLMAIGDGSDSAIGNPHETGGDFGESMEPRVLKEA